MADGLHRDENNISLEFQNRLDQVEMLVESLAASMSHGNAAGDTLPGDDFPRYAIIWWPESEDLIPKGWFKCDGTNGTPDLRHVSLVMGVWNGSSEQWETNIEDPSGSAYLESGGTKDHNHADHPEHSHTLDAAHSHALDAVNTLAHTHQVNTASFEHDHVIDATNSLSHTHGMETHYHPIAAHFHAVGVVDPGNVVPLYTNTASSDPGATVFYAWNADPTSNTVTSDAARDSEDNAAVSDGPSDSNGFSLTVNTASTTWAGTEVTGAVNNWSVAQINTASLTWTGTEVTDAAAWTNGSATAANAAAMTHDDAVHIGPYKSGCWIQRR